MQRKDDKWSVILTSLALKNGVENIQTAGYNAACTVFENWNTLNQMNIFCILFTDSGYNLLGLGGCFHEENHMRGKTYE